MSILYMRGDCNIGSAGFLTSRLNTILTYFTSSSFHSLAQASSSVLLKKPSQNGSIYAEARTVFEVSKPSRFFVGRKHDDHVTKGTDKGSGETLAVAKQECKRFSKAG